MKSKDKSGEQRFVYMNAANRNSYLNIIFIILRNKWKPKKTKILTVVVF